MISQMIFNKFLCFSRYKPMRLAATERSELHGMGTGSVLLVCIPLAGHVAQLLQSSDLLLYEC